MTALPLSLSQIAAPCKRGGVPILPPGPGQAYGTDMQLTEPTLRISVLPVMLAILALPSACTAAAPTASVSSDQEAWTEACADWDEWDKAGPPFRIHENSYYVGTCGIAAILITGDKGHVLIDGGTERGADLIAANIQSLGFALEDVKILLHSHEHGDHVGGLAKLQSLTGARLIASPAAVSALSTGKAPPDDPQFGVNAAFPASRVDEELGEDMTVQLGSVVLRAIATPGHTAGALSWYWDQGDRDATYTLVYADSLSPVSSDSYRFSDHPAYLASYRAGLERLATLDCAILLTPHPSASDMRSRMIGGGLADSSACRNYAAKIGKWLDQRLAEEAAGGTP